VSPDSRHATVRVAIRSDERHAKKVLEALDHASGFLRRELAGRLQLRHVPELHFAQDKNPDVDSRVDMLLKKARKTRARE